jgi:hypothetical protein
MGILLIVLPRLLFAVLGAAVDMVAFLPRTAVDVAGDIVNITGDVAGFVVEGVSGLFSDGDSGELAPLFTHEIDYWSDDIIRWSRQYGIDPNLLATIMQIESCGHPTIASSSNAQGLFQVMPFHFAHGENMVDPDTNAMRGANFLNYCLAASDGDAGLAMGCYNGGPSVLNLNFALWPDQTQRYYNWGMGIYVDAQENRGSSDTLDAWLDAGGATLCDWASDAQEVLDN